MPDDDFPEGLEPDDPDPYDLKSIKWGWEPHTDSSMAKIAIKKAMEAGTLDLPKAEPSKPGPVDDPIGQALYRKEVWSSRPKEREKQVAEGKPYITSLYPGGGWHCTCPGYGFRRWQKCSHVVTVEEEYRAIQHRLPAPSTNALDPYGKPYQVDEDGFEYFISPVSGVKCHRLPVWDRKWHGDFKAYYKQMIEDTWEAIRRSRPPDFDPTYGGRIYDFRRDSPLRVTTGEWPIDSSPLAVGGTEVDV